MVSPICQRNRFLKCGHMPEEGDLALTGVGVCMPIIMIVSAFAALISSGGAPRASICLGKGDTETAERILGNCLSLQLVVSTVLTVLLLLFNRPLLLTFGASENTVEYAVSYMSIYALGTVFVQLTLGMNAFITAQGGCNPTFMYPNRRKRIGLLRLIHCVPSAQSKQEQDPVHRSRFSYPENPT